MIDVRWHYPLDFRRSNERIFLGDAMDTIISPKRLEVFQIVTSLQFFQFLCTASKYKTQYFAILNNLTQFPSAFLTYAHLERWQQLWQTKTLACACPSLQWILSDAFGLIGMLRETGSQQWMPSLLCDVTNFLEISPSSWITFIPTNKPNPVGKKVRCGARKAIMLRRWQKDIEEAARPAVIQWAVTRQIQGSVGEDRLYEDCGKIKSRSIKRITITREVLYLKCKMIACNSLNSPLFQQKNENIINFFPRL